MQIKIVFISVCVACSFAGLAAAQTPDPHAQTGSDPALFETSDRCIACHSRLSTASGQDVSIGYWWRASMMANSARDPYWHAAVRREVTDHPAAQSAVEDKCSTCHMPMARFTAAAAGGLGQVFANLPGQPGNRLAVDGVSCTVCHQIRPDNFGEDASFEGGFVIDLETPASERRLYGPHDVDAGRQHLMQSAGNLVPEQTDHLRESELCATCHTLFTQSLNDQGEVVGELAEQVPYLEWRHSDYRGTRSCQDCHMPELTEDTAISSVLGEPRPAFSQHVFRGGNAFMIGILSKHRDELGVPALPQELAATVARTKEFLATDTAAIEIESVDLSGASLDFDIRVESLSGHKLPTAYPSRRVWLHVRVTDSAGRTLFESGAPRADGSIAGNDNDENAARFEPHYDEITRADQVQIYEPILVDWQGNVTTGLLYGVDYIKDNRILPTGFDKATAPHDVAVFGDALDDSNFVAGGDRVRYRLDLGTRVDSVTVEAELLYQSIGFRWAENLRAYRSAETDRFVGFYAASAGDSAMRLAADSEIAD